jgi:hypothetical protein
MAPGAERANNARGAAVGARVAARESVERGRALAVEVGPAARRLPRQRARIPGTRTCARRSATPLCVSQFGQSAEVTSPAPGPVRPEEREDLAGADLEREAIDGADVAERLDQVLDVYHRLPSQGGEHSRPVSRARPAAFPRAVLPKRPPRGSANAGPWRVESVQSRGRSLRTQDGIPDLVRAVAVPRAVQPPREVIQSAVPFEH